VTSLPLAEARIRSVAQLGLEPHAPPRLSTLGAPFAGIGEVLEIAVSGSKIRMDASTLAVIQTHKDPSISMSGQVGSQVKMVVGNNWLVANVRTLKGEKGGELIANVDFLGEGGKDSTGRLTNFRRGVSSYPSLGDVVCRATKLELEKAYACDNNSSIRDALVIVLRPGVKVADVTKDNIGQKFLTKATTNSQGQFQLENPVPRNQKFSVIVIADGFEPLYEDGVLSTEGNVPDRFDPWGTITLKRE